MKYTPTTNKDGAVYIRLFKDSLPADIWESYCMGFNIDSNDPNIQSLLVYVDPDHLVTAEYNWE